MTTTGTNRTSLYRLAAIITAALTILCAASLNASAQKLSGQAPQKSERSGERFRRHLTRLSTDSLFKLGTSYLETDHVAPDSALMCFITAQSRMAPDLPKEEKNAIAKSYVNAAFAYSAIYNDFAESYVNLRKAERICLEEGFEKILAPVYLNIAVSINRADETSGTAGPDKPSDESNRYLFKAYDLAEKTGYHEVLSYALFNIVNNFNSLTDPRMLSYIDRWLKTDIPDSEPSKAYISDMCLGIKAINDDDFDKALAHFEAMDTVTVPFHNVAQRMEDFGHFLTGMAYEGRGMRKMADREYMHIRKRAIERGDIESELWAVGNLHFLAEHRGDTAASDRYLLEYYRLKGKLAEASDNDSTLKEIDLREKVKEYETELALASLKESRQRIIIISVSILSICIIAGLLLTLRYSRKRREYIRALYEKNIRQTTPDNPAGDTVRTDTGAPDPDTVTTPRQERNPDDVLTARIVATLSSDRSIFDPDYQMARLCADVGSNSTYVSKAINTHYGKSFKAVLTELRIREACRRLDDPAGNAMLTIEAICLEVGFRSRAAFSVAFKNVTGLTPTEYRNAARRYMPGG